jgi:hypothetical protein
MRGGLWSLSLNTLKRHMGLSFATHSCHAFKLAINKDLTIFLWRCAKLWKVSGTQSTRMKSKLQLSWKSPANDLMNVRRIFCKFLFALKFACGCSYWLGVSWYLLLLVGNLCLFFSTFHLDRRSESGWQVSMCSSNSFSIGHNCYTPLVGNPCS